MVSTPLPSADPFPSPELIVGTDRDVARIDGRTSADLLTAVGTRRGLVWSVITFGDLFWSADQIVTYDLKYRTAIYMPQNQRYTR
jgi:hypothetical protein